MIDKTTVISRIDNITRILREHGLAETVSAESERIIASVNDYAYRVLMIGGFSSGKSAFLNTLLGRDLLTESQAPETTIAAELVYDSDEYVEAVLKDGTTVRFELNAVPHLPGSDWQHLVHHINCPFLEENPDIIFVDMPGIDSSIESHNKAISQYIAKGSAYILLVSCEDGTLKKSTVDFLNEITYYPQSLCCFVSKADLKIPADVEQICCQVESEIENIYGSSVPVSPISVFDSDFERVVMSKISCLDPQFLFERKYAGEVNAFVSLGKSVLQTAKKAQTLDCSAIDQKIADLDADRKELLRQLDVEKRKIIKKYNTQILPAILSDLENALTAKAENLTSAAMVSPDAFTAAVNSVIRPVLYTSTEQHIENSFEEFIGQLDLSFLSENNDELKTAILDGLRIVGSCIDRLGSKTASGDSETPSSDGDNARNVFQGIAAVAAIATDVVSPFIELLIVFLPTIIDIVSVINRNAKIDELRQNIQMVVIPEIVRKLSPEIQSAVHEARDAMIQEIEKRVTDITAVHEDTLIKYLAEKKERSDDYHSEQEKFSHDIHTLETYRLS